MLRIQVARNEKSCLKLGEKLPKSYPIWELVENPNLNSLLRACLSHVMLNSLQLADDRAKDNLRPQVVCLGFFCDTFFLIITLQIVKICESRKALLKEILFE